MNSEDVQRQVRMGVYRAANTSAEVESVAVISLIKDVINGDEVSGESRRRALESLSAIVNRMARCERVVAFAIVASEQWDRVGEMDPEGSTEQERQDATERLGAILNGLKASLFDPVPLRVDDVMTQIVRDSLELNVGIIQGTITNEAAREQAESLSERLEASLVERWERALGERLTG